MNHTRGPWGRHYVIDKPVIAGKNLDIVCDIRTRVGKRQALANAKLIAAAPEMFELILSMDKRKTASIDDYVRASEIISNLTK